MKIITITAVVLAIGFFAAQVSPPRVLAAAYSTKVECLGIPITISATAPSSVTAGSAFSITNVSSTTTVPANVTVTKIVSSSSITNAAPSTVSGTWSGSGTNTFTATYPNVGLTATGGAGSQIALTLSSIVVTVNGAAVTCNSGGTLTANGPGESLTLFSISITGAPAASSSKSAAAATNAGSQASTPAAQSSSAQQPASQSPATSQAQTNSTEELSSPAASDVSVTVFNQQGKPQSGAKVSLDGKVVGFTNSKGKATLKSISYGSHNLAVTYGGKTVVRGITTSPSKSSQAFTVHMPKSFPLTKVVFSTFGLVMAATILGVASYTWKQRRLHHVAPQLPQMAAESLFSTATPAVVPQAQTTSAFEPTPDTLVASSPFEGGQMQPQVISPLPPVPEAAPQGQVLQPSAPQARPISQVPSATAQQPVERQPQQVSSNPVSGRIQPGQIIRPNPTG